MAKRYKGKYVAQVEIDIDVDAELPDILPFDEIKENITIEFTPFIKEMMEDVIDKNFETVTITQQYADLYLCETDDD